MAIRLKPIDRIVAKFVSRASGAGADYKEGVQQPRRDQAEAAAAAAQIWADGVQQAITAGRFAKGVRAAGTEKYTRKASTIGAQRYPQGVQAAQADFQAGVTPFLETIAALTLPERFPKGDPRNNARVSAVTEALRKKATA